VSDRISHISNHSAHSCHHCRLFNHHEREQRRLAFCFSSPESLLRHSDVSSRGNRRIRTCEGAVQSQFHNPLYHLPIVTFCAQFTHPSSGMAIGLTLFERKNLSSSEWQPMGNIEWTSPLTGTVQLGREEVIQL
jgi:hypothetical protein